jgi:hypothetical protein
MNNKTISLIAILCLSLTFAAKCPKYSCGDSKEGNCAHSTFNVAGDYQEVVLETTCKNDEKCYLEKDNVSVIGKQFDYFYKQTANSDLSCGNITELFKKKTAFPGEKCGEGKECLANVNSKCEKNLCTGKKEGDACQLNAECFKGNYCNLVTLKYSPQIDYGMDC